MRQKFPVRRTMRDSKAAISPQPTIVREAARILNISDKPARADHADTGRGLQQADFGKLSGRFRHQLSGGLHLFDQSLERRIQPFNHLPQELIADLLQNLFASG